MKVLCTKDALVRAVEIAARVSARTHALPIMQTVRIEARSGVLEIRATNLELGLIASLDATVHEEGVVAVPTATLLQTITLAPSSSLTLTTEGDVLCVESAHSRSELKTFSADDFPTINYLTEGGAPVDGPLFSQGIKSVAFAASQSSIKPELGAVYIHQRKPNTLTFVATDSFRLAERTIPTTAFVPHHALLIPSRNALELSRTIESLNESPTVVVADNQIALLFPSGIYLVSRTIEGNFPDYEQIIPKEYQTHATALVKDVEHGLRAANVFANKFMQVSFDMRPSTNTLTLRSENTDHGKTEETIRVDGNGADLTLSFNQHYLMEGINHLAADSVLFSLAGIGRPLIMKSADTDTFRYLVMPMNK